MEWSGTVVSQHFLKFCSLHQNRNLRYNKARTVWETEQDANNTQSKRNLPTFYVLLHKNAPA
uniref:Uncharacterized protein n=1 Tax=Romanomermis culicivorax TaxID=13658 RepID=A0A915K9Q4_ROMCU